MKKRYNAKAVRVYKDEAFIKEIESLTAAAYEFGTSPTEIFRACRNKDKLINGYRIKYK